MRAGVAAASQPHSSSPAPAGEVPKWATRATQHGEPVLCMDDCMLAWLCLPCGSAISKGRADRTNCCYNLLCWGPCGSYNYVRNEYNIAGVCGDDMCYTTLCTPCMVKQALTESRLRGAARNTGTYDANVNDWDYSLFDCSCCELCHLCFCTPCAAHTIHQNLHEKQISCCFTFLCTNPLAWYGQVRNNYGIITDFPVCEDVCLPMVCFLCAMNRAKKQSEKKLNRVANPESNNGEIVWGGAPKAPARIPQM